MTVHLVSTVVLAAHWTVIAGLSVRVILRRPPVGVAVAWMAVIFGLPFAGAALYLLFGEKRLGRRRAERLAAAAGDVARWQGTLGAARAPVGEQALTLARHAERVVGFPPVGGSGLELLTTFGEIFDRVVADVDGARERCDLAFYIWHEGGRVGDLVDALVRAAGRGVRCRVLADALGSQAFLRGRLPGALREAGVQVVAVFPTGPLQAVAARGDLRYHRKLVVVDGHVAYTGSQNAVDPRFFKQDAGVGEWVDAMARITGAAVASLDGVFQLDWTVATGAAFESPAEAGRAEEGSATVQVVPSGPGRQPDAIQQLLLTAIYAARRELVATTPYFVPDEALLTALVSAARRGVAVTIVVPARNDSLLVGYASAGYCTDLLLAGARVAQFTGGLLHTKSVAIDGEISVFGSVNLDIRSLWLNQELSLLVYDRDFTARLRALQDRYLGDSRLIDPDTWSRRSGARRFLEGVFRLFGPLL